MREFGGATHGESVERAWTAIGAMEVLGYVDRPPCFGKPTFEVEGAPWRKRGQRSTEFVRAARGKQWLGQGRDREVEELGGEPAQSNSRA